MNIRYAPRKRLSKAESVARDREWEKEDREVYGPAYKNYLWNNESYITAKDGQQLLGFAFLEHEGGVIWLAELLVFEKYRGKGIGTELMKSVIKESQKLKCHKIILETNAERTPAMKLYKKFGFTLEARLPHHYAKRESILMAKYL